MKLGSRALDILIALASRPGEVLSKDELTQIVWRGAFVDETAVRVAISAARKALGENGKQYIVTVPGRGYCFALDVAATKPAAPPGAADGRPLEARPLPASDRSCRRSQRPWSRRWSRQVTHRRLLSLVGPGGIGKTTVALAVAERLQDAFDAIAFVDLAPWRMAARWRPVWRRRSD